MGSLSHHTGLLSKFQSEIIYGGMDGSVTTFAIVAAGEGAHFGSVAIIILGIANLLADGFSMSVGSYLSSKSSLQHYEKIMNIENWSVEHTPEEEREEIRKIYREKGFSGFMLDEVVSVITSNKERWVNEMMKNEMNLIRSEKTPIHTAAATFVSFVLVGSLPLLIYVLNYFMNDVIQAEFVYACIITTGAFILIGFFKSRLNKVSAFRGISETLVLGVCAALIAYVAGVVLDYIVLY